MDSLLDHKLLDRAVKAAEKLDRGDSPTMTEVEAVTACWRMWGRIVIRERDKAIGKMVEARHEAERLNRSSKGREIIEEDL